MSDFRIDPVDPDGTNTGRGTRLGLIFLFVIICAGVIAGAVWLFYFSGYLVDTQQRPQQKLRYIEIKIDDISLSLREGETRRLGIKYVKTADSRDIDTRALRIQWHSENPQVATVSPQGDVMARSQGSARISAYVVSDSVSSNTVFCQVNVWPRIIEQTIPAPSDTLSRDTASIPSPAAPMPEAPAAKSSEKTPEKAKTDDDNIRSQVSGRLQKK